MTNFQQLKQLARQGQPEAIAELLNHALSKDGLQATVSRHEDQLQISLMGSKAPDRAWIQRLEIGLKRLGISSIQQVQIKGFQDDRPQPVWQQSIALLPVASFPAAPRQKNTPSQTNIVNSRQSNQIAEQTTKDVPEQKIQNPNPSTKDKTESLLNPWVNGALCVIAIALALTAAISVSLLTNELLLYLFHRREAAEVVGRKAAAIFSSPYRYPVKHLRYFLTQYAINGILLGLTYLASQRIFHQRPRLAKPFLVSVTAVSALVVLLGIGLDYIIEMIAKEYSFVFILYQFALVALIFLLFLLIFKSVIQPLGQESLPILIQKATAYISRNMQQHHLVWWVMIAITFANLVILNPSYQDHLKHLGYEDSTRASYHKALVVSWIWSRATPSKPKILSIGFLGKVYSYKPY